MAKFKHNNFLDTVDEVFSSAKQAGVLHLNSQDLQLTGNTIRISGKDLYHFGTTGYLGLEQDKRLKKAAIEAIKKYGTQFPLSRTYVSHPLYLDLENKISAMYNNPVIITKNSTLGHIAVIPTAVSYQDAVILDHQVHWSVQNAVQVLKTRGVPVEMIRHNNLNMLEDKIKELRQKASKIWYMADGVYSMYGDFAPVKELLELSNKYPQLYLYFDDVHGMSWKGKNGTGYVLEELGNHLPDHVLLIGTLSKTFGASGAVLACSDKELHRKIKTFGGPLTFSAQLEPASVAAASASADIHLSPEIYLLQNELSNSISYFNELLEITDLPLITKNTSPVFFIGAGMPVSGYNFMNRLMKEGFFVNMGIFPAVPVKNTGIRITISRHNGKKEIKELVEAMVYHYPKALEETNTNNSRVRKAFKMPEVSVQNKFQYQEDFKVEYYNSIAKVDKKEWNCLMGRNGTFDWEGQLFLEEVFSNEKKPEHNWSFHYFIIKDKNNEPVLATFFSKSLSKDDMLAPAETSLRIENQRKDDSYYLTSNVLSMGSYFTEGDHLFINYSHSNWKRALLELLQKVEELDQKLETSMVILRDFKEDEELNKIFHEQGFIKVAMPDSAVFEDLSWGSLEEYINNLSPRSRKHFMKEIKPYEEKFELVIKDKATEEELDHFYQLYENVKNNNPGLNTFSHPRNLYTKMSENKNWEFLVLYLKQEFDTRSNFLPVGVMFCYKNLNHTYVPAFIGMDYEFTRPFNIYRQLLFQTIKRAKGLNLKKIDFGLTASFEKRKLGATIVPKYSYIQAKDNFALEMIDLLQNERN